MLCWPGVVTLDFYVEYVRGEVKGSIYFGLQTFIRLIDDLFYDFDDLSSENSTQ
jgi:hypothetical protein